MKAFLDTSVLVSTFYGEHEHHAASFALFLAQNRQTGSTAAHCLAEVYAVLTGMPGKDRASGDEALLFLGNVRERLKIVALTDADYIALIDEAAALGVVGGGIYDAVIAKCARVAKAESIYTWNVKHFTRLGPDVSRRVKMPH